MVACGVATSLLFIVLTRKLNNGLWLCVVTTQLKNMLERITRNNGTMDLFEAGRKV
jgi:hypothetical protein